MSYIGSNPNQLTSVVSSDFTTNSELILANTRCVYAALVEGLRNVSAIKSVIGEVFYYAGTNTPTGTLPLNGLLIEQCDTTYPDLWSWVSSYGVTCTLAEYNNILNTTGQCAKFGIDTANKKLRIPFVDSNVPDSSGVKFRAFIRVSYL